MFEQWLRYRKQSAKSTLCPINHDIYPHAKMGGTQWYWRILINRSRSDQLISRTVEYKTVTIEYGRLHHFATMNFREVDPNTIKVLCSIGRMRFNNEATLLRFDSRPLGVVKTVAHIARLFYWPMVFSRLFQDTTRYVRQSCLIHISESLAGLFQSIPPGPSPGIKLLPTVTII